MTTWNISAVWYPLWACVAFLLVVTAAYFVGKISVDNGNGKSLLSRLRWDSGPKPGNDAESPDKNRLWRSTATGSAAMGLTAVVSSKMPYVTEENLPQRSDSFKRKARGSRRAKRLSLRERGAPSSIPQSEKQAKYYPPVPPETVPLGKDEETVEIYEAAVNEYAATGNTKNTPHTLKQMKEKVEPYSMQGDASSGDSSDESRTSRRSSPQRVRVLGEVQPLPNRCQSYVSSR
ncbi:hypothetical protein N7448_005847 [Penicillium atrosanguineum]|nr:hypothetical protein N7448_005847 [Penicillium atrosanguineum]